MIIYVLFGSPYAVFVFKAFKESSKEHPAREKEFQAEIQGQINSDHDNPYNQKLQVPRRAVRECTSLDKTWVYIHTHDHLQS